MVIGEHGFVDFFNFKTWITQKLFCTERTNTMRCDLTGSKYFFFYLSVRSFVYSGTVRDIERMREEYAYTWTNLHSHNTHVKSNSKRVRYKCYHRTVNVCVWDSLTQNSLRLKEWKKKKHCSAIFCFIRNLKFSENFVWLLRRCQFSERLVAAGFFTPKMRFRNLSILIFNVLQQFLNEWSD